MSRGGDAPHNQAVRGFLRCRYDGHLRNIVVELCGIFMESFSS
jgi:hypothetical protein